MRLLILVAWLLCIGYSAIAQTTIPAIDDDQITMDCTGRYDLHGNPPHLSFGGGFRDRVLMVFDKTMFPDSFESVELKLVAHSYNRSSIFRLTLFTSPTSDVQGDYWEYRFEEFYYIGTFEIPPSPPNTNQTFLADVLDAINFAKSDNNQFVFVKVSNLKVNCPEPECHGTFASLNSSLGLPGPELVFSGVVPTKSESMGDIKSMFR